MNLEEKHAVTVAEKTVLLPDGVGVSGQYPFPADSIPAKALTSMRRVDSGRWKLVRRPLTIWNLWPGPREDAGLAGMSPQRFTAGDLGAVLEGAGRGSAYGNYAIPRLQRGVDRFGGCGRKGVMLCVKMDIFQCFCANGLERSQADVEGDGFDLHFFLLELRENFGREVKAGGGGGGRAKLVESRRSGSGRGPPGCRRGGCRAGAACGRFC